MPEHRGEDPPPLSRGNVVRWQGKVCRVLDAWEHGDGWWCRLQPAYAQPVPCDVPAVECQRLAMALSSPRSSDYWPRNGGGNE